MVEVAYRGFADLIKQIDSTTGDVLVVKEVSPFDFEQIDSRRGQAEGTSTFLSTQEIREVLIITIPTAPHKQLHGYLNTQILLMAAGMRLEYKLYAIQATQYTQQDTTRNRQLAGEGDSAQTPLSKRPYGDNFPTLVIEAGQTRS